MPALEGKKMFLYIAPKKTGAIKKSQQKLDREKREAEEKALEQNTKSAAISSDNTEKITNGGLFANAKNGDDVLKKLKDSADE